MSGKRTNKQFGKLLGEGISSVARRKMIQMGEAKSRIAEALGFSVHTVEHWRRGHVPTKLAEVEFLVRYCAKNGRVDRTWAKSFLHQVSYPDSGTLLDELFGSGLRIFLSYQRDVTLDREVALKVAQALSTHHAVFFDQTKEIDPQWAKDLQGELNQADCVIFFFSAQSIHSEVVLQQLGMTQEMSTHAPKILPVCLGSEVGFPQGRRAVLESLNWAFWQSQEDTPRLINELQVAIGGGELPLTADEVAKQGHARQKSPDIRTFVSPAPSIERIGLQLPDGTLTPECPFYVERGADELARAAIRRQGVTITIKGARQMGKSSLLQRLGQTASQLGKRFVWLDCELLHEQDAKSFFQNFSDAFTDEVGLDISPPVTATSPWRCTRYVSRQILPHLEQPCVLALDNAESLFDTTYRKDFFSMLRTWHNNRASKAKWKQLDLVVLTSTEPYYFIDDLHQSPFNVGEVIELQDFTQAQVADLNQRHEAPLTTKEEQQLMTLLHGHPYLVRRALYLLASNRITAPDLFAHATNERGPFGDHLRALLWLLHTYDDTLRSAMQQVLRHRNCPNEALFFRLRGAGLVRRDDAQDAVVPRCPLYGDFLRKHLSF